MAKSKKIESVEVAPKATTIGELQTAIAKLLKNGVSPETPLMGIRVVDDEGNQEQYNAEVMLLPIDDEGPFAFPPKAKIELETTHAIEIEIWEAERFKHTKGEVY